MTWCSNKPFRSPELDPSAIVNVPKWSHDSEPIEAWINRQRDAYQLAIRWINENRSKHLRGANLKSVEADVFSNCKLLIYECQETVEDGASEAASMGFYDGRDAPPWDTWILYRNGAVFCSVPFLILPSLVLKMVSMRIQLTASIGPIGQR